MYINICILLRIDKLIQVYYISIYIIESLKKKYEQSITIKRFLKRTSIQYN